MKNLAFVLLVLCFAKNIFADESADREPAAAAAAAVRTVDQAKLKQYAGGRDEQDIKVQPNLAQPPKNIDGSAVGEMTVPDDHD